MKDIRLLIEEAHPIKGTHQKEKKKTHLKTHHRKVLEPGIRSLKTFQKAK